MTGPPSPMTRSVPSSAFMRDFCPTSVGGSTSLISASVGQPSRPLARMRTPEVRAGLALLPGLLALLPELRVCVLAGRAAAAAAPTLRAGRPDLPLVEMPHPSPTYVCTSPAVPRRIVAALRAAAAAAARPDLAA